MIAVCDGCGKQEAAVSNGREWFKPSLWYERTPEGESRPITACIEIVEDKRVAEGKKRHDIVMPF